MKLPLKTETIELLGGPYCGGRVKDVPVGAQSVSRGTYRRTGYTTQKGCPQFAWAGTEGSTPKVCQPA